MAEAKKHPIPYRTRELLLSKREKAEQQARTGGQLLTSFAEQIERMKWRINAGEKMDPADVDRMGQHFKHEASVVLQALSALHGAMKAAYPKGKILWTQDLPAPWDPPGTEATYCHPDFEDEARRSGLLPEEKEAANG